MFWDYISVLIKLLVCFDLYKDCEENITRAYHTCVSNFGVV